MKLKKIASLALAGIMAVSMLAGCKDGGNGTNNGGASSDNSNTNSGYSAYVVNMSIAGDNKNVIASDDAKLNAAVENFVKNKPVNFTAMSTTRDLSLLNNSNHSDVKVWMAQVARDMSGALATHANGNDDWADTLNVTANKDADTTAYGLYYISAAMNDDVIDNLVADKIDAIVDEIVNGGFNPDEKDDYTFTVSATKEYWQVGKDADVNDDGVVIGIAVNFEYNKAEY